MKRIAIILSILLSLSAVPVTAQEPDPVAAAQQQADQAEANARAAQSRASQAQAEASAAVARASQAATQARAAQQAADQAAREAEQKRLAATQAEAQTALDRARAAEQAYGQAAQEAERQLAEAGVAIQRSSDALQAANDALAEMSSIKADLAGKSSALASTQAALEKTQAEIDNLNDVLRAERGMTMWLQGALLLLAVSALAAITLLSRRRPVTERIVEIRPIVLVQPAPKADDEHEQTIIDTPEPYEPGVTHLDPKFAAQILRRYGQAPQ